ncbi:MAG: class I SAM-dependent rRNA methyltransferase [Proteobacteria bacterium]|nr:class I SAM-dependent rRNA methyltransferase [Pseudomonadota bacterium]
MNHHTVVLNAGKEKPVLNGHPWIFSGAIKSEPKPQESMPGDLVDVLDSKKQFIARGYYNHLSQIRVRVLTRNAQEFIHEDFLKQRISASIARRNHVLSNGLTTGVRLVAHESDQLPGLVVDQFGAWVSFQILTAGMDVWRKEIIKILLELLKPDVLIERSDEAVREKEGLKQHKQVHYGQIGDGSVQFLENGIKFVADVLNGHKTGFYLDQRDSRRIVGQYAKEKLVLNCFSYTGGFAVSCAQGGATKIVNVDESMPALDIARRHLSMNGFDPSQHEFLKADVFSYLRELRSKQQFFDMIILDPPKFITSTSQMDKACRGYKDLNLLAMQLLRPGGLLATFSCSGLIDRDLFQKVVFGASVDAKSEMQIVQHLSQAEDHPVLLSFPESMYLKGMLLRKV